MNENFKKIIKFIFIISLIFLFIILILYFNTANYNFNNISKEEAFNFIIFFYVIFVAGLTFVILTIYSIFSLSPVLFSSNNNNNKIDEKNDNINIKNKSNNILNNIFLIFLGIIFLLLLFKSYFILNKILAFLFLIVIIKTIIFNIKSK